MLAETTERVFRIDLSSEGVTTRHTPSGGLVVQGNVARTGIQVYHLPDGTVRRELRHPEEVFKPDSLASFEGAPLTEGHPGKVSPDNWRDHALGTVAGKGEQHGKFVRATFHINDGPTIKKVDGGKLTELSVGYDCSLDHTPGVWEGEPYDASQHGITVNHVAMGPRGWGRAGPEVRLHLDGGCSIEESQAPTFSVMTPEEKKALEAAEAASKAANEALSKLRQDSASAAEIAAANLKKVEAENQMLTLQVKRLTEDSTNKDSAKAFEAKVEETIRVRADGKSVFTTSKDPEAKAFKADGKDLASLKREIVHEIEPDMKLDGLDGAALDAVYTLAMSHWNRSATAREQLRATAEGSKQDSETKADAKASDDDEEITAADARQAMIDAKKAAWQKTDRRIDRARGRSSHDSKKGGR